MNANPQTPLAPVLCCLLMTLLTPLQAQQIKKVVTDATIDCGSKAFTFKDGRCVGDPAKASELPVAECKGLGLAVQVTTLKCTVVENQAPVPRCVSAIKSEFDPALGQCVSKDETPRSSLGDYVGDCFRIHALPTPAPANLKSGATYGVMAQRLEGTLDKVLTLSETTDKGTWKCGSKDDGKQFDVKASDLIAFGADRTGWAYGVLALPYKFHFDDKSFGSGVSIGPYFGRRWGTPGSAYMFAMAATIGSVKGEVRDAQGNITGTPDLQAFSLALGYMYDIAKGVDTRPFKIGFFVGADVVGSDNVVKYKHNKKPWMALQIGFDFTDN